MAEKTFGVPKIISILYEDPYFIVFDKPQRLLVIPTPKKEQNTLIQIVNEQYANRAESGRLYPCHRLDRETSGAIIFAKTKRYQKMMMVLFEERTIKKTYIAFVQGHLSTKRGEIRKAVRSLDKRKFRKKAPAQRAITRYNVLEKRKKFSIVDVYPVTGRGNQIRIHFSQIRHPLVGDRKYALGRDCPLKFRRTALHAHSLEFKHPVTNKTIKVTSRLPKDMEVFLERHRS